MEESDNRCGEGVVGWGGLALLYRRESQTTFYLIIRLIRAAEAVWCWLECISDVMSVALNLVSPHYS